MTRPSGRMSTWALGLVNRSPAIRSSTMPPRGEVVAIPVGEGLDLVAEPAPRIGGSVHRSEVDHRVAVAGAAVVVLDHDPAEGRVGRPERLDGLDHVVGGAHVLRALRDRHARPADESAAFALEAEVAQPRSRSVDRHAERERQADLHLGDVPALDQGWAVADDAADLLEPLRVIEQLRGDGADGPVIDVDEGQPRPERVAARGRRERHVVVDDGRVGRTARDVHDVTVGNAPGDEHRVEVAVLE